MQTDFPKKTNPNNRIGLIIGFMAVIVLIVLIRLIYIQVFKHNYYLEKANAQQSRKFVLEARRGQIYVYDNADELYPIALNQESYLLAADPKYIKNESEVLDKIARYVPDDKKEEISSKLKDKELRYLVINKKISGDDARKIKEQKIPGIILISQDGRSYPEGELFAQVTGYVNDESQGQYGLEQSKNKELAGTEGVSRAVTDALGVPITSNENTIVKPLNGSDLVLTLDRNIQAMAYNAIESAVKTNKAVSGSVVIMDPKTGAIKAMASYPSYDPNNYSAVQSDEYYKFANSSVTSVFEPGSGFKVITMAAGLNENKFQPETTFNDTGEVQVDDRTIKNAENKKYGTSTMTDIIQKSLNTGVVYILKQLGSDGTKIDSKGKQTFYDYIKKFGYGEKTGIEFAAEAKGYVKEPSTYNVDYANMTFGQGISVTNMQLINSVSAIANGGTLYKPYIVDRLISPSGEQTKTKPSIINSNVISTQTAAKLSEMMEQVVQRGSGWPTRTKGYRIAGKTGTAQVPKADGSGYEEDKNIGSFVGFAPVEDPKFVMLVRVNYPKVDGFAEKTAVPTFAEIARQLFMYYQIAPSGN
jgi:cell division protein FtsI (penicillin-binding protein 3)